MDPIHVPSSRNRNARYFQFQPGMTKEVETEILEIASSTGANQVCKPELDDNQKRWLITGICLHSILAPALRQHVRTQITEEYNKLKKSKKIHMQTHKKNLQIFSSYPLNYSSINNNPTRWANGHFYDFRVKNEVDFSKLFVQTHMAKYSGFDDSCDMSALLSFLINISSIFPNCGSVANTVRKEVRNKWAHCSLVEWDDKTYMNAFQLMYQLLKNLRMPQREEKRLLSELTKWEKNGILFMQGTSVDLELLRIIKEETKVLALYSKELASKTQESFDKVQNALESMHEEMAQRIDYIDQKQQSQDETIGAMQQSVEELQESSVQTKDKLSTLEYQVSENRAEISELKEQVLSKPKNSPFFYPPNKVSVFVGRQWELETLSKCADIANSPNHVDVISGLGGCGKTTMSIEYAWKYQELYPAGVFWMSADTDESLDSSILKLAIDIGIVGCEFKDIFYKVLKWLAAIEQRWLLVIDNLDSEELSRTAKELIMGAWMRKSHGHIIVTTRREQKEVEEDLQVKEEKCLTLDYLTTSQSIEFLLQRSGRNNDMDRESLEELATELGGLPLALEQAAAHIKNLKCSFEEYVSKFKTKRLKLLKNTKSSFETNRLRLAVRTTWQLNFDYISKQSDEEGLGDAAYTVLKISSFLHSDSIPIEIFNCGQPTVTDEDLRETLSESIDVKQIISILTRFSLFQQTDDQVLSVHRLVQEVVRDSIADKKHTCFILECAMRMINSALQTTKKPYEVLYDEMKNKNKRGALNLWSVLASNAISLKVHVRNFIEANNEFKDLLLNNESANLFQTSAIYHSVHQRQDQALADQDQMLHVMSAIDISEEQGDILTSIKIPLLAKDRTVLQECMASTLDTDENKDMAYTPLDIETLKIKGDDAYNKRMYAHAIQYYSEGIRASDEGSVVWRLYCNRTLAYLRMYDYMMALDDANKCIEIDPGKWKAFCCKAYAIAGLIKERELPCSWDSAGMTAASVAARLHPEILLNYKMKIEYPLVIYNVLEPTDDLTENIETLLQRPFTSLLLKKGLYNLERGITARSVQVIGVEEDVRICISSFAITRAPDVYFKIKTEESISVHFENVSFQGNCAVNVSSPNVVAMFLRCRFSTGQKACEKFPSCDFGEGCSNPAECIKNIRTGGFEPQTGLAGSPGIECVNGGKVYLDSCVLDRCGGGGTLVIDDGSYMCIKNCTVKNMRQSGIEAREGGTMHAMNNIIVKNQAHGVILGPKGNGLITGNFIIGNGLEGIYGCGNLASTDLGAWACDRSPNSVATISDNRIAQNDLSGIALDGGIYTISGNSIFENWCWGIMINRRSSTQLLNNDIYENKCGGVHIGTNYSAPVCIDGNTTHDHFGPALYILPEPPRRPPSPLPLGDEISLYTKPPIITARNAARNNDRKAQHITKSIVTLDACNYCHVLSKMLKLCTKCKKAKYCSKECQGNHWKRHKYICRLLKERYVVEINMKSTQPLVAKQGEVTVRSFDSSLEGIGQAKPPDRNSSKSFVVKVQGGTYSPYDPSSELKLYDQSLDIDFMFENTAIYNLLVECGCLATDMLATKKLFLWASFRNNGNTLCLHTDSLPDFQKW